MRITKRQALWTAPIMAVGLMMAACGGSTGEDGGGGGSSEGTTVNVVVNEWSVVPTPAKVPAGKVTFVVKNEGEDLHELVALKTDLDPTMLPLDSMGDVDEEAAGVTNVGEIEDIEAGKSGEFTIDMTAGKYAIICNISMAEGMTVEHHYMLGMRAGFTVE